MFIVLVTGGAGFIGSHLCRRLLREKNKKVICIDNLITGSIGKIDDLLQDENFVFIHQKNWMCEQMYLQQL